MLTYPRTDARVLPDDYVPVAIKTMEMLAGRCPPVQGYAKKVLDSGWIKPDKRIFNTAKMSDHFAIIPTGKEPESLPPDEAALYKMVAQRFVAVFYPPAENLDTERITKIEADHFKSRGRVVLKPGWTVVYGADAQEDDEKEKEDQTVPAVGAGEHPPAVQVLVVAEKTKPPPPYTEAAPPVRDGGSRQDHQRGRTARGHVGSRPGHPRHTGRPSSRVCSTLSTWSAKEGPACDSQGNRADHQAEGSLAGQPLLPAINRRVGAEAAPDGAGEGPAQRLHARYPGKRGDDGREGEERGAQSSARRGASVPNVQEDAGDARR